MEHGACADVFAKCWGPCRGLDQYFYNGVLDMEDAGRRVTIVRAEVDNIGALHEYKDNAKPHFLFYVVRADPGHTFPSLSLARFRADLNTC
eukprot:scaffold201417_cov35-Tisochrysis_lutea.AAC.2